MPTSAATARGRGLVVAGQQDRRQAERAQRRDRLGRGRLDGVGDDEDRLRLAVPAGGDRGLAARLGLARGARSSSGGRCSAESAEQRRAAGDDGVAVDDALDAEALAVGEARRPAQVLGRLRRRSRGRSGARSSARASRPGAARPSSPHDLDERHPAGRHRAGLVEHDRVDAAGGLEHLRALDQQAELGAAAGADHQRDRRRQAERARAGDDQHGDGGGERERRALARAEPEAERGHGERDHDRDEDARRRGRRAAGPAPCRSAPRSRAGRSGPARCRRRPWSRGRRAGRRR